MRSSIRPPQSHRDIIGCWPSIAAFAADIGVPYGTAKKMSQRGSIGSEHWINVTENARKRDIRGITVELLARIATAQSARRAS
jgi:hypothetical protein